MKPIGKYIAVQNIDEEIKTESGILLSGEDANQFRYRKAIVKAPGSDVHVIKEGDVLYYDKAHGFTMIIKEQSYTMIRESDVVVVE